MTASFPSVIAPVARTAALFLLACLATSQPAAAQSSTTTITTTTTTTIPVAMVFADKVPVSVDATALEVRNIDTSPTTYPYVGNRAPVPYEQAIRAWAAQRFVLTGNSVNTLRVTMRQGTITEKLLPVTHGIAGWFKKEQNAEYAGTLDVEISIVSPSGEVLGTVDGKSWASETIREDATSTDRQNTWMSVTKTTFDNLDREMIPRLRQALAAYVR